MGTYWLLDQDDGKTPIALVETDGGMHIIDVQRFGPGNTKLEDQQKIWDSVIGVIAPTLKPLVDASSLDEAGVEPHADLMRGEDRVNRSSRTNTVDQGIGGGRTGGGPSKKRSRGDR